MATAADEKPAAPKVTYEEHVQPIFRAKCFGCHNQDKKSGGLDLTNLTNIMQGGSSGTVIEPGDAANSYLFMLVNHDSQPNMPPEGGKLPDEMIATIKNWIDGGAPQNASSKIQIKKKTFDFALDGAAIGKPSGPPAMPERLALAPVVHTPRTTAVTALATSPWAPLVAVAGQKQVLLYHAQTLELLGVLPFPEGEPEVIKFSRNGSLLLAGGGRGAYQGKVVLWDVKTGERVNEVGDEVDSVLAADISSDHTKIALGGPSRMVRIYDARTGELLHSIKKHTDWVYAVAFSPDGVLLASADRSGGLHVWEAHTAREYLTLKGHTAAVTDLSWRSDSNILASASEDTTIQLWEMENGGQVKRWGAHGGGVASVEFTRDGRLVSCGRDNVAKLWDQNGGQQRAFEAFGDLALAVTFADEADRVVASDWTGVVRVWNAADGARVGELAVNPLPLEERLKAAEQALAARKAEHEKLAAGTAAALAVVTKAKADLATLEQQIATYTAQVATLTKTVADGKLAVTTLTNEVNAATQAAQTVEQVVAPLTEAVAKGQAAQAKAGDDKELIAAVAALKAQLDGKSQALATAKQTVTDKTAALTKAKEALAAAEKQLADTAAALKDAQAKLPTLQQAVPPADAAYAEAKKLSDASAQALDAAQKEVAKWKTEIAYRDKLAEVNAAETKQAEASALAEQAQAELTQKQSEVTAAQQAVTAAQKQAEAGTAALEQAKQTVATAAAKQNETAKGIQALEAALPALQEAATKAEAAAAKVPGDQEVAAALQTLKTLHEKKTTALAELKKVLPAKTAEVEKAKQGQTAAEQQLTAYGEALEQAQAVLQQRTAEQTPAQQKLDTARKAAEAAKAGLDALKKQLDAIKPPAPAPDAVAQAPAQS